MKHRRWLALLFSAGAATAVGILFVGPIVAGPHSAIPSDWERVYVRSGCGFSGPAVRDVVRGASGPGKQILVPLDVRSGLTISACRATAEELGRENLWIRLVPRRWTCSRLAEEGTRWLKQRGIESAPVYAMGDTIVRVGVAEDVARR